MENLQANEVWRRQNGTFIYEEIYKQSIKEKWGLFRKKKKTKKKIKTEEWVEKTDNNFENCKERWIFFVGF